MSTTLSRRDIPVMATVARHVSRWTVRGRWLSVYAVTLVTLGGLALRLPPVWAHRFHQDEALYASWALLISTHRDVMLRTVPVDKPPLFLYVLAHFFTWFGSSEGVARIPGLIAGTVSIPIVFWLGRRLYGMRIGLIGALLFAASPMAILMSPTAFTDPLMLLFGLLGCVAATYGAWGLAGLGVGLAAITKQQGVFFLPLTVALGLAMAPRLERKSLPAYPLLRWVRLVAFPCQGNRSDQIGLFALGLAYPIYKAIQWDSWRFLPPDRPGFLAQSAISYGGLGLVSPSLWLERAGEWAYWLQFLVGSPWLSLLWLLALFHLLIRPHVPGLDDVRRLDLVLVGYGLAYLGVHVVVSFQIWDRYLLPLAPVGALLAARAAIHLFAELDRTLNALSRAAPVKPWLTAALIATIVVVTGQSAVKAADSGFPVGSDHGAYDGIDEVATFLKSELPPGAVLYHRWLGWHWRYYLYDAPFHFLYYDSTEALVEDADGPAHIVRYIVFPGWREAERQDAIRALNERGLIASLRFVARRADGSVSFTVYRIERQPHDHP